ncbi:MAG: hypothetical protein ACI8TP_001838 [Acidimicrobiales bacterium]|jgi:hypothetical protein
MRKLWIHQDIDAAAVDVWPLLVEPRSWPQWGPSVKYAELEGEQLSEGTTGVVTTVFGIRLGFEITSYAEGSHWAWKVGGIDATDHRIEPLGSDRCRVSFGVPWSAAPYGLVCRIALQRIRTLAERPGAVT